MSLSLCVNFEFFSSRTSIETNNLRFTHLKKKRGREEQKKEKKHISLIWGRGLKVHLLVGLMAGAIKITCIGCAVLKPVLAELAEMPLSWLQGPFCELTVGLQQKRLSNQAITAEIRISHLKPVLFLHFCYVWSCYVSLKILNHFLSLCIEIDWILDAVKTITSAQIYLHNSLLIFGNQVQALSYPWWKAIGYKQVVTSMQLDGWGN